MDFTSPKFGGKSFIATLTLGSREMNFILCFLCGRKLFVRMSIRKKPYFVCLDCEIQTFIRGRHGIERLNEFFKNAEKAEIAFKQHAQSFHEMQAILKEIAGVDAEIDKLGFCLLDDRKTRIRRSLERRRANLFFELEQFVADKSPHPKRIRKTVEM